jgi:hypothetical protein
MLKGRIDEPRYNAVLARLAYQAGHSIVWRDAVCGWFRRASGIPDSHGRVGNHPGRVEGESMTLDGYAVEAVTPWETASGGKAIGCSKQACSASFRFDGRPDLYDISVQYFDERTAGHATSCSPAAVRSLSGWRTIRCHPTGRTGTPARAKPQQAWSFGLAIRAVTLRFNRAD